MGKPEDDVVRALHLLLALLHEALAYNRWPEPADADLALALSDWWRERQRLAPNHPYPEKR